MIKINLIYLLWKSNHKEDDETTKDFKQYVFNNLTILEK